MNEHFSKLPKEKQLKIINAGMEYFGKYGYKKAVTDDIAARAGISKGLLFHYFDNKKNFYLFLYDFSEKLMMKYINMDDIKNIDDFFELINYGAEKKLLLISHYPYILNFILKAYYLHKEDVSSELNQRIKKTIDNVFDIYFRYFDFNKFKDDIDPRQVYHMLLWMGDGYLMDKQRMGKDFDVDEMLKEFKEWERMFKMMCYKEEYL